MVKGLASANPSQNIISEWRIAFIANDFPYSLRFSAKPHESKRHLKKHEPMFKQLTNSQNPKERRAAQKMQEERFILDCHDLIFTPLDDDWKKYAFSLLSHTIHGKWSSKQFTGFHLLNKHSQGLKEWEEVLPPDKHGVWKGRFEFERNGKTEIKESTMFPKSWTPSHLMFEGYSAFKKIDINLENALQFASTQSGLPVILLLKNSQVQTIYPIHENDLKMIKHIGYNIRITKTKNDRFPKSRQIVYSATLSEILEDKSGENTHFIASFQGETKHDALQNLNDAFIELVETDESRKEKI